MVPSPLHNTNHGYISVAQLGLYGNMAYEWTECIIFLMDKKEPLNSCCAKWILTPNLAYHRPFNIDPL